MALTAVLVCSWCDTGVLRASGAILACTGVILAVNMPNNGQWSDTCVILICYWRDISMILITGLILTPNCTSLLLLVRFVLLTAICENSLNFR